MESMSVFNCPSCGAPLPPAKDSVVTCTYCGNKFTLSDGREPARIQPASEPTPERSNVVSSGGRKRIPLVAGAVILAVSSVIFIKTAKGKLTVKEPSHPDYEVVMQFGEEGKAAGQFMDPRSIAVDMDGNLYVGYRGDPRIQKFDPAGHFVYEIRVAPGAKKPDVRGLATDYAGHLYAVSEGNIYRYDTLSGRLLSAVKGNSINEYFENVCVDAGNNLYAYSRIFDDTIVLFDQSFRVKSRWKRAFTMNDDDLAIPEVALAVDGAGDVYGVESGSGQVFVFNKDGKYRNRFGEKGTGPGQFDLPEGAAVDGHDRLYIANSNSIDILTNKGHFLFRIPRDYENGVFRSVAIGGKGFVYAITANGRVIKYRVNRALQ